MMKNTENYGERNRAGYSEKASRITISRNRKSRLTRGLMIALLIMMIFTTVSYGVSEIHRGDLVRVLSPIHVPADQVIQGDVVSIVGNITIEGEVTGDVVSIIGNIEIGDGSIVYGDVVNIVGSLGIGAAVGGDAIQIIGNTTFYGAGEIAGDYVSIVGDIGDYQGRVGGQSISIIGFLPEFFYRVLPGELPPLPIFLLLVIMVTVLMHVLTFFLGAALVSIFPGAFQRMSDALPEDFMRKGAMGVLLYIGFAVAIVTIALTIIGIPLLIFVIPLFFFLQFMGNVIVKVVIGRRLLQKMDRDFGMLGELFVGTLVYMLFDGIIVGRPVTFFLKFFGMGQLAVTALERKS